MVGWHVGWYLLEDLEQLRTLKPGEGSEDWIGYLDFRGALNPMYGELMWPLSQ